jgi:hypothetical protein
MQLVVVVLFLGLAGCQVEPPQATPQTEKATLQPGIDCLHGDISVMRQEIDDITQIVRMQGKVVDRMISNTAELEKTGVLKPYPHSHGFDTSADIMRRLLDQLKFD